MQPTAGCPRRRRGRHHGFPTADIALNEPYHRTISVEVGVDVLQCTRLRICQAERQRLDESCFQSFRVCQHGRGFGLCRPFEELETQVMSQQFLERESALSRMTARIKFRQFCLARWAVHVCERVFQCWKSQRLHHMRWNPVAYRGRVEFPQRLRDERA